ncbi:MAG TPA: hypothetical protein VJ949_08615 [Cryomorphaceae bacterium]|nr:hypothetical protein [Cryomorphaceae bacterium]
MIDGKNKRKKWRPAELEDQSWFPEWLRAYQMAFLSTLDRSTGLYLPVNRLLVRLHPDKIVDLASGSGESVWRCTSSLRKTGAEVTLTDKFPFAHAANRAIYHGESLDILTSQLPDADLYTMFNAFHHFDEEERTLIAKKATKNGAAFLVIEPLRPGADVFFKVFFATFIGPFLLAPFMRPFSVKWLLLTYIFPLGMLATCWDGLASVVKSLGKNEWNELEADLISEGKTVEHGLLPSHTAKLKYFLVK